MLQTYLKKDMISSDDFSLLTVTIRPIENEGFEAVTSLITSSTSLK